MIVIERIEWQEIKKLCQIVVDQMKVYHERPILIGIPRNGSLVASIMAFMDCKVSKYITHDCQFVVDEISDSGVTLENYVSELIQKHKLETLTAVLYKRHDCKFEPTVVGRVINHDDYLLMPWENETEIPEKFK